MVSVFCESDFFIFRATRFFLRNFMALIFVGQRAKKYGKNMSQRVIFTFDVFFLSHPVLFSLKKKHDEIQS